MNFHKTEVNMYVIVKVVEIETGKLLGPNECDIYYC